MKTLRNIFLVLIVTAVAFGNSLAQDYKHPFNVNSKGEAYNEKGVKLGWIESDGTIKNSKGEVVGKVDKKELKSSAGKKMGEIQNDNSFKDGKGKVKFTISTADENGLCKIVDESGKTVGTVHENYKQQGACMIHCLQNKK